MPSPDPVAAAKDVAETVEQVDLAVTEAVAEQRERPLVRFAGWVSEVGDQPQLRAITLGTAALGLARRDPRLVRAGIRAFAAHTVATWAKTAIKRQIDRTRPDHALETRYRMEPGDSDKHELSSFPSGHTAGALAVTQAFARDYPQTRAAGLAASAAIAAIQVPRCKHFISDILAGALIGWAAERATSAVFDRVGRELPSK